MEAEPKKIIPDKGQDRILQIFTKDERIPKLVLGLAAPGSGKTSTIVRLILQILMGRSRYIRNFLVLTFTKKTRQDILSKIQEGGNRSAISHLERFVRNFHSLAFTSLFWDNILTDTQINDKIDELAAETEMDLKGDGLRKGKDEYKLKKLKKQIKQAIAHNRIQETIDEYQQNDPICGGIFDRYISWLQQNFNESKTITYDYALIKFVKQLQNGRNPLGINLQKIDLLVVDEFQDSNPAQMKIVQCILKKNPNMKLLMMGDIDQTIYTWRGTDLVFLNQFIEQYREEGECQQVQLQNTHRLGKHVLDLSQSLIKSRPKYLQFREKYYLNYVPVPLNKENDHPPLIIEFESEFSEVRWVMDKIKELVDANNGINYRDITVLLRSFKFNTFFKKFQFQNTRRAQKDPNFKQIPFTVKTDENNENLQIVLAWFVYFYKKKFFPLQPAKWQIRSILKNLQPTQQTVKKMIESNTINRMNVTKARGKQSNKIQHKWDLFFIDFNTIEKIIKNQEKFTHAFKQVYHILREKEMCQQLTDNQWDQFIDYASVLEVCLNKEQNKKDPIFTVLEQIILKHIYRIKKQRKTKKKKEEDQKKLPNQIKDRKNVKFLNLVKQKFQRENTNLQQLQKKQAQSRQNTQVKYINESDSVRFQTTYGAKGLQYKVVFICSLNYDFEHEDYEPCARPKRSKKMEMSNDAQRERLQRQQLDRHIMKQEEELRVIYTALTRTSKYCFVTSSKQENYRPWWSVVKHPHFEYLKLKGVSHDQEYRQDLDGQFKSKYEQMFAKKRLNKDEDKEVQKNHSLVEMFKNLKGKQK